MSVAPLGCDFVGFCKHNTNQEYKWSVKSECDNSNWVWNWRKFKFMKVWNLKAWRWNSLGEETSNKRHLKILNPEFEES